MSGHSKWSVIKRKKGALDAKRGAIFTKIIREITVAAKTGGDDIEANPRLRAAVNKAKSVNMPSDNIERAIKKGSGTLDGLTYEEIRYEGYGPGGAAIMVDCLTDNKNRTTPEIKIIFSKNGGNMGETGSVSYLFDRKGIITIEAGQTNEDALMEELLEFDVEDITSDDAGITVITAPDSFNEISELIMKKGFNLSMNELTYVPKTTVTLDEKKASQCLKIIELLEDHDDSQSVYSNYDIPDDIMAKIEG